MVFLSLPSADDDAAGPGSSAAEELRTGMEEEQGRA
jgi:hypothetical protein